MLVVTRKTGEEIVVPECNLRVKVIHVTGSRVRMGISAPAALAVLRAELLREDEPVENPGNGGSSEPCSRADRRSR